MTTGGIRSTVSLHALMMIHDGRCAYCSRRVIRRSRPGPCRQNHATRDHVVPRRAGGTDTLDNVVLACSGCNRRLAEVGL